MNLAIMSYEEVFEAVRLGHVTYDEYEEWLLETLADRYSMGYEDGWHNGCNPEGAY